MVVGMPTNNRNEQLGEGFSFGKKHQGPLPCARVYHAKERLEPPHDNLCSPLSPMTPGGNTYLLLIIDDHSQYMWSEVLRTKHEALKFFKKMKTLGETEVNLKTMVCQSDRSVEFNSLEFAEFCNEDGDSRHTTTPHLPQQNDVVEGWNQNVVDHEAR